MLNIVQHSSGVDKMTEHTSNYSGITLKGVFPLNPVCFIIQGDINTVTMPYCCQISPAPSPRLAFPMEQTHTIKKSSLKNGNCFTPNILPHWTANVIKHLWPQHTAMSL